MSKTIRLLAALIAICALALAGCAAPQASATAEATVAASTAPTQTETPAPTVEVTASPAATGTPEPAGTPAAPQIQGLILVVPVLVDNVTVDSNETRDDGTYHEGLIYDGMVGIDIERLKGVESTETAVQNQIKALNEVDVIDMKTKKDDAISARLSYPAWRVTYTTGENEDMRANVDIYVQTDEWDFRFHTATPSVVGDDYKDIVESWFEAMSLDEAN